MRASVNFVVALLSGCGALGGACKQDSDCAVPFVCESGLCAENHLRAEADRASGEAAASAPAAMLRMDEPARARLTAKASGDWAIVRDPGRACFWVTRKDGRWTLAGSALAGAVIPSQSRDARRRALRARARRRRGVSAGAVGLTTVGIRLTRFRDGQYRSWAGRRSRGPRVRR